jgi:hypothetical protein
MGIGESAHQLQEGWLAAVVSRRPEHANPSITISICALTSTASNGNEMRIPAVFAFADTVQFSVKRS